MKLKVILMNCDKVKLSYFLFLISYFLFTSCSVSKQISKQATTILIKDSAISMGHIGISIYEPATNKYWYNYQAEKYFVPASNTKLFTLYAGMKYLGDSLPGWYIKDTINTLYIKPNGDPTFLHPDFKNQIFFDYLKNTKKKILLSFDFKDKFQAYGNGWAWNDYAESYMPERSRFCIYGNVVTFEATISKLFITPKYFHQQLYMHEPMIQLMGVGKFFQVTRVRDENLFSFISSKDSFIKQEVPFKTDLIWNLQRKLLSDTLQKLNDTIAYDLSMGNNIIFKKFYSQPSDSLFTLMMHRSDNFFAEQTLLMASNEKLGYMSDRKMIDTLLKTDLKDIPQKPQWVDGSGLSRYNLFTPKDFVYILQKLKNEFGFERLKVILPTGGTGTLSSLYKKDSGYIFAKTGTLNNHVALSGFLITKKNKLLIFSILPGNFTGAATPVRKAIEKFLSNIRQRY